MNKRTTSLRRGTASATNLARTAELPKLGNETADVDVTSEIVLPRDHPKWTRDRFTVSAATKALIDRIKPTAIRVFGFWDHRAHRIAVESGTIEIDMSGSYRCDAIASS